MNGKKFSIAMGVCLSMMLAAQAVPADAARVHQAEAANEEVAQTASASERTLKAAEAAGRLAATEEAGTAEAAVPMKNSDGASKEPPQTKLTRTWEIQAEYLEGRFFKDRHIDDYNLHVYQKNREVQNVGVWYGLTLSRPIGYTTEDKIYRDSEAVGLGPSMMLRWERPLAGKLTGSLDGTGSLVAYNQAHPGDGRAYGFLWRIGPRLLYHATEKDAVSLAYIFHHSSNGWKHHNPGYNGVGFSLGWTHTF